MKKIILLLTLLIPNIVFAYTINNNDIYVEIKDDKISYRENIKATFEEPNEIIEKTINKDIFNINVSTNYINKDNIIKIDSLNYNTHKYIIKYDSKIKNKKSYKIDLSNSYNTNIENIDYNIELPTNTKKEEIKFYLNNEELKDINFNIEDNKLYGSYTNLKKNDNLVIEINKNNLFISKYLVRISILLPIIFVIISYLLWLIFGKDRGIEVEKTSIPPRKENPVELALMYNGKVTNKDIIYMILNLANRGYIKIVEHNKEFIFIRTKQYTGCNYKESVLFKSIFKKYISGGISDYINILTNKEKNKKIEYLNEINMNELKKRMNYINNEIINLCKDPEEKNKYFEKEADSKKTYLITMIAIILVLVTSIPFIELNKISLIPISILFSIVSLAELIKVSDIIDITNIKYNKFYIYILLLIILWIILIIPILKLNTLYIISYIVGLLSSMAILILYKYMPRRTIYATRQMGKVEGLKKFINTCTEEELRRVLETNTNYYYDLLSYSYIIGINNKLTSKIKKMNIKEPIWYEIDGEFTIQKLNNSIGRLISTMTSNED